MIPVHALLMAAAIMVASGVSFSASADIVYMKSGEIINGKIVDETPGQFLRIHIGSGATWVLYYAQISRIEREGQAETNAPVAAPAQEKSSSAPAREPVQSAAENRAPESSPSADKSRQSDSTSNNSAVSTYVPFNRNNESRSASFPRTSFGFVIGPGFYHLHADASEGGTVEMDGITGLVAGGLLEIQPNPYFSFQTGLLYTERGSSQSGYNPTTETSAVVDFSYDYLAIPIEFKFKIPAAENFALYGLSGLNLGILTSSSIGVSGNSADAGSVTTSVDLGFELGGGMEFPTNTVTPFFDVVYYWGFTNVWAGDLAVDGVTITNQGLEVKGGLKFRL